MAAEHNQIYTYMFCTSGFACYSEILSHDVVLNGKNDLFGQHCPVVFIKYLFSLSEHNSTQHNNGIVSYGK